jgi:predicted ArsR family transcriptional regulator
MSTRTVILKVMRAEARPMTLAEIGQRVGITAQLARYHIKQLCATGRVEFVGVQPTGATGKHVQTFQSRGDL